MDSGVILQIKNKFPKLFVTEIINNNLKFGPEQNSGCIEYKRTISDCNEFRVQKYASQMKWRITENIKNQCATYFIGLDDDGTIVGLSDENLMNCIEWFVIISKSIGASIIGIQIIHINFLTIMKIGVKIKKIQDNYLVEFEDSV